MEKNVKIFWIICLCHLRLIKNGLYIRKISGTLQAIYYFVKGMSKKLNRMTTKICTSNNFNVIIYCLYVMRGEF